MTSDFVYPEHDLLERISKLECGEFEFRGMTAFWTNLGPGNDDEHYLVCGNADGISHVASAGSLREARDELAYLADNGLMTRVAADALAILVWFGFCDFPGFHWSSPDGEQHADAHQLHRSPRTPTIGNMLSHVPIVVTPMRFSALSELVERHVHDSGLRDFAISVGAHQISYANAALREARRRKPVASRPLGREIAGLYDDASAAYPSLACLIRDHVYDDRRQDLGLAYSKVHGSTPMRAGRPEDIVSRLLDRLDVSSERRRILIRRLRGVDCDVLLDENSVHLLSRLPPDWLPTKADDPEWEQLLLILPSISRAAFNAGLSPADLCLHAGGHWTRFVDRIHAAIGAERKVGHGHPKLFTSKMYVAPYLAVDDFHDMRLSFIEDVLEPLLKRTGMKKLDLTSKGDRHCSALVAQTLFSGIGFVRILKNSREWHRRGSYAKPEHLLSWPALLPVWTDPESGCEFVPLADSTSLAEEGGRGPDRQGASGLEHCVSRYWKKCVKGTSRIVSIRRRLPDGTFARLSTAEFCFDREMEPYLVQHRGLENAVPSDDVSAALARYAKALKSRVLPFDPEDVRTAQSICTSFDGAWYDYRDDARMLEVVKNWRPFLRPDFRDLPLDDLAAAVKALHRKLHPSPLRSLCSNFAYVLHDVCILSFRSGRNLAKRLLKASARFRTRILPDTSS